VFPAAFEADRATTAGDRTKLGTITSARVDANGHALTVVNAYTQFHWRGRKPLADYDAIRSAFRVIRRDFDGMRIGYPRIGAGLAGGDWTVIAAILDEELHGMQHTLVEYSG
jgi:O-acetyl-ADP-ribose deacetylase (regulator of RNase III)